MQKYQSLAGGRSGAIELEVLYSIAWQPQAQGEKKMKIRNFTPHPVTLISPNSSASIMASEGVARCIEVRRPIGNDLDGIGGKVEEGDEALPLYETAFGEVTGLPEPELTTILVVSRAVCEALPHRTDLFCPDKIVRNEQGQIIGAEALCRPAPRTFKTPSCDHHSGMVYEGVMHVSVDEYGYARRITITAKHEDNKGSARDVTCAYEVRSSGKYACVELEEVE